MVTRPAESTRIVDEFLTEPDSRAHGRPVAVPFPIPRRNP